MIRPNRFTSIFFSKGWVTLKKPFRLISNTRLHSSCSIHSIRLSRRIPALFTNFRIDRNVVPEGLHAYDIRESDDGDRLATIEPTVMVNHGGTILTRKEFITEKDGYVQIDEYGFEASMTLEEWLEEQLNV